MKKIVFVTLLAIVFAAVAQIAILWRAGQAQITTWQADQQFIDSLTATVTTGVLNNLQLVDCSASGDALTYSVANKTFGCTSFALSGGGQVNTGTAGELAYYAANGNTLSGANVLSSLTIQAASLGTITTNQTLSGQAYEATIGANVTLTLANAGTNHLLSISLVQPSSGGPFQPTFAAASGSISWVGGGTSTPAMCTTAGCTSIYTCKYVGASSTYKCWLAQ